MDYDGILSMMQPADLPEGSMLRVVAEESPAGWESVKELIKVWDGWRVSVPKLCRLDVTRQFALMCAKNGDSVYKISKKCGRPIDVVQKWLKGVNE